MFMHDNVFSMIKYLILYWEFKLDDFVPLTWGLSAVEALMTPSPFSLMIVSILSTDRNEVSPGVVWANELELMHSFNIRRMIPPLHCDEDKTLNL